MQSEIQGFYKNKSILLTGGSGFLGRVIIEKLLRETEVSKIFALVRPKRGKTSQDRVEAWKTDPLFGLVLQSQPNALDRVVLISGDCKEPDLGISFEDRELLKKEAQIVMHSAASVNFADPLHLALDTNTRATRLLLQLAKEMKHFVAFVHVSTSFSNCVIKHATERFYPGNLSCSVDKVLKVRELCDNDLVDAMAPYFLDKYPNTYTYTKALAEQVIQTESEELPVCIFRPGAIVATSKEPMPGWIDNIYGPIAMIYGAAMGVLRVAPIRGDAVSIIVPVDYCANCIIASAWKTAKDYSQSIPSVPMIYNFVPHVKNPLTNNEFAEAVVKHREVYPLKQAIWYPFLRHTSIPWLFNLLAFFYHLIPGYIIDILLRLRGQKPRMIKLYTKVHKSMNALAPFTAKSWSYETPNTDLLWESLCPVDKQLFEFDMKSLDWNAYFIRALGGMLVYLVKEDPSEESLKEARKHLNRLRIYHRLLQFILISSAALTLKWLYCLFL